MTPTAPQQRLLDLIADGHTRLAMISGIGSGKTTAGILATEAMPGKRWAVYTSNHVAVLAAMYTVGSQPPHELPDLTPVALASPVPEWAQGVWVDQLPGFLPDGMRDDLAVVITCVPTADMGDLPVPPEAVVYADAMTERGGVTGRWN